jgi:cell wall-associated NlpC family hydrolase
MPDTRKPRNILRALPASGLLALVAAAMCIATAGALASPTVASAETDGQAIVADAQAIQAQSYPQESFSSARYIYCFDGGTTSVATPGTPDPDPVGTPAGGSYYSNCNSIGRVGFDCRGLALYAVYQGTGGAVSLPTATAQAQYSGASKYGGSYVSLSSVQPGDLVYFGGSASDVEHVGIVVSGSGDSAEIVSAVDEGTGITTKTVSWFLAGFNWVGAVAIPGVGNTVGGGGSSGPPMTNGSFVRTPNGSIYVVAGGAAIHVDSCAPLGGCAGLVELPNLAGYASEPSNGTFLRIADGPNTGLVARVAGGVPLGLDTCEGIEGCNTAVNIDSGGYSEYANAHQTIQNGTFLRVADGPDTGLIGRVVGGVLLGLVTCEGIEGCDTAVNVDEDAYNWYAAQYHSIANGTFIRVADGPDTGLIGRVVGGVLLGLPTCEGIEGCDTAVNVDEDAYNYYAAEFHTIANGTFMRVADGPDTGLIGRVVGGVLLGLVTCEGIEGCDTAVNVPESTYGYYADEFHTIANGTFVRVADGPDTGLIARAAGGALLGLTTCEPLEECQGQVNVDANAFNSYTAEHPEPANGTILEGLPSGTYWSINNGERTPASASAQAVAVDDTSVDWYPLASLTAPGVGSTQTSSTSPTSTGARDQGVLGTKAQRLPVARLASASISASRAGTIILKITCPNTTGTCTGNATVRTLTAILTAVNGHKRKAEILTLASGNFTATAGRTTTLELRLSGKARSLLSRIRTLRARVTITGREPKGTDQTTATIHAAPRRARSTTYPRAPASLAARVATSAGIRACGR